MAWQMEVGVSAEQTTDGAVEATEMELRVARAMCEAIAERFDAYQGFARTDALAQARAAIRAMREPTSDMIAAGAEEDEWVLSEGQKPQPNIWRAMIDAASPGR